MARHHAQACVLIISWLCLGLGARAHAVEVRPMVNAGLMQQPASQYFHLIQGGSLDISLYRSWAVRATYLERPVFRSAGYVDQDLFAFAQTGSSFFNHGIFDIYGFAGVGKCWGYIKEEEPSDGSSAVKRNDYTMNALALTMEGASQLSFLEVRIGHSLLVGKSSSDIYQSKVAWPFSIYYLTLSVPLLGGKGSRR